MENFRFIAYGLSGGAYLLGSPAAFELDVSYAAPADAFEGTFLCSRSLEELTAFRIYLGDALMFDGIVDEQIFTLGPNGPALEISSRSRAALLLDNEAVPATYVRPTLADIFAKHGKPYGLKGITANIRSAFEYSVTKGMSEWAAISDFCRMAGASVPRVRADLVLDVQPMSRKSTYTVSNDIEGALKFTSFSLGTDRYGVTSSVLCKLTHTSGYTELKKNPSAVSRGIRRRRMLNLADTVPELYDYRINSALDMSGSYYGSVTLPEFRRFDIGDLLRIEDSATRTSAALQLTGITYKLKSGMFSVVCEGINKNMEN